MILKIGVAMSVFSVALAAVMSVVVAMQDAPKERTVPAEPVAKTDIEPLVREPVEQRFRQEKPRQEKPRQEKPRQEKLRSEPEPPLMRRNAPPAQPAPLLGENPGWAMPKEGELQGTPRKFGPHASAAMTLTIPSLGIYDAPIFDAASAQALEAGVSHVPETSMPWDGGAQRNVFLAAHRLGYPGTGSRLLFYELDKMGRGDEVVLRGRGETYRYRVREVLVVGPNDSWVMAKELGHDMVSLQTCTPIPTFEKRLVVRADRI
jgi:sortase A